MKRVNSDPSPPVPAGLIFLRRHSPVCVADYVEIVAGQVRPFVREPCPARLGAYMKLGASVRGLI
jgi:hypothetical protein